MQFESTLNFDYIDTTVTLKNQILLKKNRFTGLINLFSNMGCVLQHFCQQPHLFVLFRRIRSKAIW